jgi:hypothetical protein
MKGKLLVSVSLVSLLYIVIFFSTIVVVRALPPGGIYFHYKMSASGGYIAYVTSNQYTYDMYGDLYGFQIFDVFYFDSPHTVPRDSNTWGYEETWYPFVHTGGDCDILVYKDVTSGPPFPNDYEAFPDDSFYYGSIPPGGNIVLPAGRWYYLTTQGFSTLDTQPIYPPQLCITYPVSTYNDEDGDSCIWASPQPKLIDTMDISGMGIVSQYELWIDNHYDDGNLGTDPVEISFAIGYYSYKFWLELDGSTLQLYACCTSPSPVGGVSVLVDNISVDKFGLLAPYIGLASTILITTAATAIYVKRGKQKR